MQGAWVEAWHKYLPMYVYMSLFALAFGYILLGFLVIVPVRASSRTDCITKQRVLSLYANV